MPEHEYRVRHQQVLRPGAQPAVGLVVERRTTATILRVIHRLAVVTWVVLLAVAVAVWLLAADGFTDAAFFAAVGAAVAGLITLAVDPHRANRPWHTSTDTPLDLAACSVRNLPDDVEDHTVARTVPPVDWGALGAATAAGGRTDQRHDRASFQKALDEAAASAYPARH